MEPASLGMATTDLFAIISGSIGVIATVVALVLATGIKPLRRSIDKLDNTITVMSSTNTTMIRESGVQGNEVTNLKARLEKAEAQIDFLTKKK